MSLKNLTEKRRVCLAGAVRSIDTENRTIRAYASTKDWDRYGERFEPDAFKEGLANYKKNPVVLFGHNYGEPPIGKTIGYEFDENGLILTMQFADTPRANEIFDLYKGGFMTAFSVGFRPLEVAFEERVKGSGDMGAVYKKAELLENSAVPVPANPGAVVMKSADGQTFEMAGDLVRELLMSSFEHRIKMTPETVVLVTEDAPEAFIPLDAKGIEKINISLAGGSPSLKDSLEYLLGLGKIMKHKGKVEDEDVRSLLMQMNNLCRELIYGPGSPRLEDDQDELSAEQIDSMVRECELLATQVKTEEDKAALQKALAMVTELISGN